jgi:hypothetical protein
MTMKTKPTPRWKKILWRIIFFVFVVPLCLLFALGAYLASSTATTTAHVIDIQSMADLQKVSDVFSAQTTKSLLMVNCSPSECQEESVALEAVAVKYQDKLIVATVDGTKLGMAIWKNVVTESSIEAYPMHLLMDSADHHVSFIGIQSAAKLDIQVDAFLLSKDVLPVAPATITPKPAGDKPLSTTTKGSSNAANPAVVAPSDHK